MVNPQLAAKSHQWETQVIKARVKSDSRFKAYQEYKEVKPVNNEQASISTFHPDTIDKLYMYALFAIHQ